MPKGFLFGIGGGAQQDEDSINGLIDGTISEFALPIGIVDIWQYRFYGMTSLTKADLTGATKVGTYAFYNCTNIEELTLPNTLNQIDSYAFSSAGSNKNVTFSLSPTNACDIGSYAFQNSKLRVVDGKLGRVGSYAFSGLNLTKLHASIEGAIDGYAFDGNLTTSDISLTNLLVTSLGSYAFSRFGCNRPSPESNIIELDFLQSTFTAIQSYAFGYSSSTTSSRNKYMILKFSSKVKTIASYAFRYNDYCDYYFYGNSPATLSGASVWGNATNYNIFVPFGALNAYRTATNWAAQETYIKGFAPANTFAQGAKLPKYNIEGYALTWYSDKEGTTIVTEVTDASAIYYCIAGTEKVAVGITSVYTADCTISITDADGNSYVEGSGVLSGTTLTITATPTQSGWVPYIFTVNGNAFTNGSTITADTDISIVAVYYNGVNLPFNSVFGNNSWILIAHAVKSGNMPDTWAVGDTKSVTLTNGNTFTIRLCDLQADRYAYVDGTGSSKAVFEFVELQPNTRYMNSSNTNSGGWADCYMRNTVMAELYALLPSDLQGIISEVNVLSGIGGNNTTDTSTSANKLFLPAMRELFSSESYSIGLAECPLGQFDYYANNNTSRAKIKYPLNSTSANGWWTRSPSASNTSYYCAVSSSGYPDQNYASNMFVSYSVAPVFAI